ncbi:MAG: U32 family peptidase [Magnetococcales bacterium]|nr:U32 family peptidase [Magnetococcales bacterium]
MKISIGPPLFDWGKKGFRTFFKQMAYETSADILYLGEVVCSKRYNLTPEEMVELAGELKDSGKEVVFSTLGLVMSDGEIENVRKVVENARELGLKFEANDMAAVGIGEGHPMVAGPHITTYNPETLSFLAEVGVNRLVPPVELPLHTIKALVNDYRGPVMEFEVFAHGRLPLTFSARCYTSRAFHLPKNDCHYKCGEFPDGMEVKTQEDSPILVMNGTETMSEKVYNLVDQVDVMRETGVDIVRLSPQSKHMAELVGVWRDRIDGRVDGEEALARMMPFNDDKGFCNGYFYGKAGLDFIPAAKSST